MSTITVAAGSAATAWLNASLASGQSEDRQALYRTLSVEVFRNGVQFIGCDGAMLFRTWAPCTDTDEMPEESDHPDFRVVVVDADKFALAFMRTLLAVTKEKEWEPLVISIEEAPFFDPPLDDQFKSEMLTLSALGQQLHCKLYESRYPDWRNLKFGVDPSEMIDGMKLGVRLFATVGKLKGVYAIDCDFHGNNRQISFRGLGENPMCGILMPMSRADAEKKKPAVDESEPEVVPVL